MAECRECIVTEPVAVDTRPEGARRRPRCRGPQPMCANPCPGGYVYKADGCMTCECADTPQPDNCMVYTRLISSLIDCIRQGSACKTFSLHQFTAPFGLFYVDMFLTL